MADAASLPLPYPEAAIVAADTLAIQNLELAAVLPRRPIVLGGCCCAHVGAVEGLAARGGRLALIWFDAHGDLNTPETSTSGNTWGMPLRMLIDAQTVRLDDVALVGARNLDPPEQAFIQQTGLATGLKGIETALEGVDGVYIALDLDVLDPSSEIEVFFPEPAGFSLEEVETALEAIAARCPLAGIGLSGLGPAPTNVRFLERCCKAAGL
jgi:arginase